jgi:peroxiredoxin
VKTLLAIAVMSISAACTMNASGKVGEQGGASAAGAESAAGLGAAPMFTLTSAEGKTVNLADFKGKYVVLEWWNFECPFVVKHYGAGNMQKLQKEFTEKGVIWLTINSSAPGKQGHVNGEQAISLMKEKKASPTHVLLDHDGKVGKMYDAKTTPQMILISPEGVILYDGAIDSIRSSNPADIEKAENYLVKAFAEASSGKPVSTPKTQPYGCSVKYP